MPSLGQPSKTFEQLTIKALPCTDSSFYKRLFKEQRVDVLYTSKKLRDGGVVVAGHTRNITDGPPYTIYGWIAKFDSQGNYIWAKELKGNVRSMAMRNIGELSDGSLVLTGQYNNALYNASEDYFDAVILRLTASGDLNWVRTFHSQATSCNNTAPHFNAIEEGMDGEILLAGRISVCMASYLSVVKLSANGTLLMDITYRDFSQTAEGIGIFHKGNELFVIGKAGGSAGNGDGVINLHCMRLDYKTGAYLGITAWKEPSAYPASFFRSFMSNTSCIQLRNGGYYIYGKLFGDMDISKDTIQHFGILEFDSQFNFLNGYSISSKIKSNYNLDVIKIDALGRAAFTITPNEYPRTQTYLGMIRNGQITSQRKTTYNLGLFGETAQEVLDDGAALFLRTAGSSSNPLFLEYLKIFDSDTSSGYCLGKREDYAFIRPLHYVPYSMRWQSSSYSNLVATNHDGIVLQSHAYEQTEACYQKSFCDTLKIQGTGFSCSAGQELLYTAFKNPECGSRVIWSIDPTAADKFESLNDNTVKISFKASWEGYLYAHIEGRCGPIKDSLKIRVLASPGPFDLGPDVTLCEGNALPLLINGNYASYEWQDGSIQPDYTVTRPGVYHVRATDGCGGVFTDTVRISAAPPIAIDLGPARIKCNADTLQLHAPLGFMNYQWSNNYQINNTTAASVVVNPLVDTVYYVRAEKTPGCYAYDTVQVKVYHSSAIQLGRDTSFCDGEQMVLNAGSGFASWQWNTGANTQQITVQQQGTYSVVGSTTEGCRSYDTLKVLSIHPIPIVNLGNDATLCMESERVLDAGEFTSYLWQNGSQNRTLRISQTGNYSVAVTDSNGCRGNGTMIINQLLPLPKDFLPADTTICAYGNVVLKPLNSFTHYLWSTNANTSTLTIDKPGVYQLQVTDKSGCMGKDKIVVHPKECMKGLYVPNAFTPNRDGKNDKLRALLFGVVKLYQFTVYNRWGEIIFQTSDIAKGWDGSYKGQPQDQNVFVWTCRYQLEGEDVKLEKGRVMLLR